MLDSDIRPILRKSIATCLTDAVVFDEFPICRRGRADLAAVNGSLWGYEIKSERDSLARLPIQVGNYERIFDFNVACVSKKHLADVRKLVPAHWGLVEVGDSIELKIRRAPKRNRNTAIDAQLRLLWRNEVSRMLRESGIAVASNILVGELWQLAASLPANVVQTSIRTQLKCRVATVPGQPRTRDDDSVTTGPSSSSYLDQ
jgi:hypothetical protein